MKVLENFNLSSSRQTYCTNDTEKGEFELEML